MTVCLLPPVSETKAYERKVVRAKSLQRVIEELQLKPNAEGAYTAKQLRDEMYTIKMRFDLKGLSTVLIAELIDECDTDADGNVTIDELSRSIPVAYLRAVRIHFSLQLSDTS
eukprot:SAG31_NODE_288_length_18400_cov_55.018851_13_plen_113_part_00